LTAIGVLLVALAPGLFWLWVFSRMDVYRPGPRSLIVSTFLLGGLSVIPAAVLEAIFLNGVELDAVGATLASTAVAMLLVVGPVEEVCKFAAVRFHAFHSLYFDEPLDGMVYGAAASLGFATLENLGYVLVFGPEVMIVRAPLSTLAHVIFGGLWGYTLGLHHRSGRKRKRVLVVGIALAAAAHGLFNLTVFVMPWASVAYVIVGGIWLFTRFKWGQRISPYRMSRNSPQVRCRACGTMTNAGGNQCEYCGSVLPSGLEALYCSHCGVRNRIDASFCTGCGDRFLKGRRG